MGALLNNSKGNSSGNPEGDAKKNQNGSNKFQSGVNSSLDDSQEL